VELSRFPTERGRGRERPLFQQFIVTALSIRGVYPYKKNEIDSLMVRKSIKLLTHLLIHKEYA
jgi:hypothetical protein